jgi:hypothetical protein
MFFLGNGFEVIIPKMGDDFATGETTNWNEHL